MDYSKLFINGKWVRPFSSETITVENPATFETIACVPSGSKEDVDAGIAAAREAYPMWRLMPLPEKIKFFEKALDIFKTYEKVLIDLEVTELGAPLDWAKKAHVISPMRRIAHFIKIVERFEFEIKLPRSRVVKEPYGVVACLTPWNYPLGQVVQKIIPAMLTGNTVVFKPSQNTPLTAYYLCQAFEKAGLPPGVLNMITGQGSKVGSFFTQSPYVSMVSFTGSTLAGKEVARQSIGMLKKVALELGGKSPLVLLRGGNILGATQSAMESTFYNSGQTCAAFTRFLVPNELLPEVEKIVRKFYPSFVTGDPTKEGTLIGPLASKSQYDKVKRYIEIGLRQGAKMIVGEVPKDNPKGYFVQPVVFSMVHQDMTIAQEEIFGPVLSIMPYNTVEDAIQIANSTVYGLSAGVVGPPEQAQYVAQSIQSGGVYVNDGLWDPEAPFGGYKESGIGREGGLFGLEEFVQLKTIFDQES